MKTNEILLLLSLIKEGCVIPGSQEEVLFFEKTQANMMWCFILCLFVCSWFLVFSGHRLHVALYVKSFSDGIALVVHRCVLSGKYQLNTGLVGTISNDQLKHCHRYNEPSWKYLCLQGQLKLQTQHL